MDMREKIWKQYGNTVWHARRRNNLLEITTNMNQVGPPQDDNKNKTIEQNLKKVETMVKKKEKTTKKHRTTSGGQKYHQHDQRMS